MVDLYIQVKLHWGETTWFTGIQLEFLLTNDALSCCDGKLRSSHSHTPIRSWLYQNLIVTKCLLPQSPIQKTIIRCQKFLKSLTLLYLWQISILPRYQVFWFKLFLSRDWWNNASERNDLNRITHLKRNDLAYHCIMPVIGPVLLEYAALCVPFWLL